MDCVIPGVNLKVLSKAIQALSKIGDELYIEIKKECVSFRSVNMTTTVYCLYDFFDVFFTTYEVLPSDSNLDNNEFVYKIPMKAVLSVFKSHGHKDKKPEFCKIELKPGVDKIIFKFKYRHDVMVIRSLYLIDGNVVNVIYNKDAATNQVSAAAQLFSQVLTNFQTSDDDISLEVGVFKALMRNYIAGDVNVQKGIRSQLTLNADEFNSFKIGQQTTITFSLRPFRAAVQFAESCGLSVLVNFETSGKPAALIIRSPTFEANFIMATLKSDDATQSSLSASASSKLKSKEHSARVGKANMTAQDQEVLESVSWDNDFDTGATSASRRKFNFDKNANKQHSCKNSIQNQTEALIKDKQPVLSERTNEKKDCDENMDVDDVVPKSPESPRSKRIRTIFGRCYESTFHASMMSLGEVLAPDSDPEGD